MAGVKKVFVFDDNRDILDLCTFILEDAGYEIKTSENANDIEKQVAEYMPDLIFMDNWLPCLLYTSPSPRDRGLTRMPSSD